MSHVMVMFNQVLLRLFAHHSREMNWSLRIKKQTKNHAQNKENREKL